MIGFMNTQMIMVCGDVALMKETTYVDYRKRLTVTIKYGISMLLICLSVSGCTSVELGADLYKRCYAKTVDDCPVDFEWMKW